MVTVASARSNTERIFVLAYFRQLRPVMSTEEETQAVLEETSVHASEEAVSTQASDEHWVDPFPDVSIEGMEEMLQQCR